MSKKISYTATFSDGKVLTRKSHREYTAAYRWAATRTDGSKLERGGFSGSRELAAKALRQDLSYWPSRQVTFAEVADAVSDQEPLDPMRGVDFPFADNH